MRLLLNLTTEKTKKVGFRLRKNQNDTEYTDVNL